MSAQDMNTSIAFSQAYIDPTDGLFTTIPEGVDGASLTDLWSGKTEFSSLSSSTNIREMLGCNFELYTSQLFDSSTPDEMFLFSRYASGMTAMRSSLSQSVLLKTLQIIEARPSGCISGSLK